MMPCHHALAEALHAYIAAVGKCDGWPTRQSIYPPDRYRPARRPGGEPPACGRAFDMGD